MMFLREILGEIALFMLVTSQPSQQYIRLLGCRWVQLLEF